MSDAGVKDALVKLARWHADIEAAVRPRLESLCALHGYGWVMQHVSAWWGEAEEGSNMVPGPAKCCTVSCVCREPDWVPMEKEWPHCDWCAGCGWLTESVYAMVKRR